MTRGRPPHQALKEAKAIARRQGRLSENTKGQGLLYDFSIHLALLTICVRIKRVRTPAPAQEDILSACRRDIIALRRVPATAVHIRELWVRSSAGGWQYFLVLDDLLVEIPHEALPENMAGTKAIRGDAPGPARVPAAGETHGSGERYFCPFMVSSQ
jgi:hypothetical protein